MAATAHAGARVIEKRAESEPECPHGLWDVNAVAGDRFVRMTLGVREDGSVSDETRSFLISEILDVTFIPDGAANIVTVHGPAAREGPYRRPSAGRSTDHRGRTPPQRRR